MSEQLIVGDINFRMVFNRLIFNEFVEREACYMSIVKRLCVVFDA
jgi:hypothetical protein